MNEPGPVAAYHRATRNGPARNAGVSSADRRMLVRFHSLDPSNRPSPFKSYPDLPLVPLPADLAPSRPPALDVLAGESQRDGAVALDDRLLGTVLFLAAGVTRTSGDGDRRSYFRAAMSAGNLHPLEVYVLRDGLHHYQPLEHALVELRPPAEAAAGGRAALLVITGVVYRTCWKYAERGWRHLWWDAGSLVANVLAVLAAHGVAAQVELGFDDAAVAELVGADPAEELPLALVRVGEPVLPPAGSLPTLRLRSSPVAQRPVRFPLVDEAHHGGDLAEAGVAAWRDALTCLARPGGDPSVVRPAGYDGAPIEDVILRRGSTRRFRPATAGAELLDIALPIAAGPSWLTNLVSVHAIEGWQPGCYGPGLLLAAAWSEAEARERAGSVCLGQALAHDSAYTAFGCADLPAVLATLGARGYRAAQFEAGLVAERLALCAFAVGAGATGLTFNDDRFSRVFGTEQSTMLATAVGLPAHSPAPSGAPGQPRQLRRRR